MAIGKVGMYLANRWSVGVRPQAPSTPGGFGTVKLEGLVGRGAEGHRGLASTNCAYLVRHSTNELSSAGAVGRKPWAINKSKRYNIS